MSFVGKFGNLAKHTAKISQSHTRSYSMKPYNTSGDLKGFTWQGMKKHYAVLPLVGIIGCAVVGMCSFIGYSAFTRPDVNIRRKEKWIEADEQVDINNPKPKKLLVFNQTYEINQELQEALKYKEEAKH